ncbi:MAG: 2,4-dihydroxyhept-2-ene-1,7-dioic acid aldolase (EC, partial [uncultured Chloroflexi bacterium]
AAERGAEEAAGGAGDHRADGGVRLAVAGGAGGAPGVRLHLAGLAARAVERAHAQRCAGALPGGAEHAAGAGEGAGAGHHQPGAGHGRHGRHRALRPGRRPGAGGGACRLLPAAGHPLRRRRAPGADRRWGAGLLRQRQRRDPAGRDGGDRAGRCQRGRDHACAGDRVRADRPGRPDDRRARQRPRRGVPRAPGGAGGPGQQAHRHARRLRHPVQGRVAHASGTGLPLHQLPLGQRRADRSAAGDGRGSAGVGRRHWL